jgi:hypothetical protein
MKRYLLEFARVIGIMMVAFSVLNATVELRAEDPGDTSNGLFCLSGCDSGCTTRTPTEGWLNGIHYWVCSPIGTGCSAGLICDCYCTTNLSVQNPPTVCYCD